MGSYESKIDSDPWVTTDYEDEAEIYGTYEVTITSGATKTIHVIFEKDNLATDYYMSSIVVHRRRMDYESGKAMHLWDRQAMSIQDSSIVIPDMPAVH